MAVIDDIAAASRAARPHIVLSEGDDPRIQEAALRAAQDGVARLTLIGHGGGSADVAFVDPAKSPKLTDYAAAFFDLRKHKGVSEEAALAAVTAPLGFAAMMVRQGDAAGTIGGAVHTTSDVVRTALQIIGKAKGVDVVSSYFLMLLEDRPVIFADCGLILQPSAEELASIAIASSTSLTALTGLQPRVAMLSFSTKGSVPQGAHESLGRIANAVEIVKVRAPDLLIDGELQFDAAMVPDVAARKAPGSPIEGAANVFVFPSLSAGNIGYKIAQRLGGAVALGPILQGLAKPANDLSRGCTADDVVQMIAITGAQAAAK
ncbi:MAG: phosphate acetyltransferase [Silicimonas sp.]|nr:phosphate acetyltransferase [Silicimonas sp.]